MIPPMLHGWFFPYTHGTHGLHGYFDHIPSKKQRVATCSQQAAEFLLTEDRGSQAPKRWQQMKKLPVKADVFSKSYGWLGYVLIGASITKNCRIFWGRWIVSHAGDWIGEGKILQETMDCWYQL